MPKIVDHQAYKNELIVHASAFFSEHGYAAASMRKIAAYLEISKSALYHYFPSKEALFLDCTKYVMARVASELAVSGRSKKEQIQNLTEALRTDFGSELAIVVEYMRGKTKEEVAADEAMQIANNTYRGAVESIVGAKKTDETLALIMGTLLMEHFSGQI